MGKGHRDNHAARKKRGPGAFAKKTERRAEPKRAKCRVCGNEARDKTMKDDICTLCQQRLGL